MKDYYKILGVEEEATEEEIHARWIELTKRYHPDLTQEGNAEEKLKEINEAYQALKDQSTRLECDLERIIKKRSLRRVQHSRENRKNIRKAALSIGIAVLFVIAGMVIFRRYATESPPPEVLYPINKLPKKEMASLPPPVKAGPKVETDAKGFREIKKETVPEGGTKSAPALPTPSHTPVDKRAIPSETFLTESVSEQGAPVALVKEAPMETSKEIRKEPPQEKTEPVAPLPAPSPAPAVKEPKPSEKPKEEVAPPVIEPPQIPAKETKDSPKEIEDKTPKETPKEVGRIAPRDNAQVAKQEPAIIEPSPISPRPPYAREEEVRQFFANYIDRYDRKDIVGFLSFFSRRAIQNQKDGFEGIKAIYTQFFNQSRELRYHMERMDVEIHQDRVVVRARYRVDQILKKGGEKKRWQGDLRSVLVKEEGGLRIITLDYQNDKPR